MLTQTRQIRITLSNLESNIRTLLSGREQFIKEFERLTKENEDLKNQITKLKEEVK
jgi:cell shape-determining protein MreC